MKKNLILQFYLSVVATFISLTSFSQMSGYYQEDFEGSFPPAGWKTVNVLDPAYYWQQSPYTPYSGDHSAYIGSAIGQGEDWLILPKVSVQSSDSFSFWLTAESLGFIDSTIILLSTTDDALSSFTNQLAVLADGDNYPAIANQYLYYSYSLSSFSGEDVYVAFKNRNYEGDGVYIDLVSIGSQVGTTVSEDGFSNYSLSIFPNPTTKSAGVILSLEESATVTISIVDVTGREIESLCYGRFLPGKYQLSWNCSTIPAGLYYCKVVVNGSTKTYKLLKETE